MYACVYGYLGSILHLLGNTHQLFISLFIGASIFDFGFEVMSVRMLRSVAMVYSSPII